MKFLLHEDYSVNHLAKTHTNKFKSHSITQGLPDTSICHNCNTVRTYAELNSVLFVNKHDPRRNHFLLYLMQKQSLRFHYFLVGFRRDLDYCMLRHDHYCRLMPGENIELLDEYLWYTKTIIEYQR